MDAVSSVRPPHHRLEDDDPQRVLRTAAVDTRSILVAVRSLFREEFDADPHLKFALQHLTAAATEPRKGATQ